MFFVPLVANAQGVAPQFVYSTDSPGSHDIWISLNPVSGVSTEVAGSPFDERLSPVSCGDGGKPCGDASVCGESRRLQLTFGCLRSIRRRARRPASCFTGPGKKVFRSSSRALPSLDDCQKQGDVTSELGAGGSDRPQQPSSRFRPNLIPCLLAGC